MLDVLASTIVDLSSSRDSCGECESILSKLRVGDTLVAQEFTFQLVARTNACCCVRCDRGGAVILVIVTIYKCLLLILISLLTL